MGSCSYTAYIDATTTPVRVRVEATCTLAAREGILEPRGPSVRLEYTHPSFEPVTPCKPSLLPVPHPPYTRVDASIVVDSPPSLDVYGLVERHSTVIALTKRTILEGGPYIQLVEAEPLGVGPEAKAAVEPPGLLAYPILTGIEWLDRVLECEANRGWGLESWGACLEEAEPPGGDATAMLEKLAEACPARGYAALAARSNIDPHRVPPRPVAVARGLDGNAVAYSKLGGLRIYLHRTAPTGEEHVALRKLEEGINILGFGWTGYSVLCRRCLRQL